MIGYMPAGTWLTVTKPGPKSAQLFTALKEVDGVCWTRIELVPGGSRHITPDSKTRLREQWRAKEEEMRSEVLQPSIYDSPLHVCFPVEWKGGHTGLKGSQAALGQGMWRKRWDPRRGGGRRPIPWTLHCERETDNRKLIPTFHWIISSFSFTNPLLPYFSPPSLYSLFYQPPPAPTQSFIFYFFHPLPTIQTPKAPGPPERKLLQCCISFSSSCSSTFN